MRSLDIVVPVYQNRGSLAATCDGIVEALGGPAAELSLRWRLVFVDDGSSDGSWGEIERLIAARPRQIAGIRLLRNFGQVAAILAGMTHSRADAVVVVSADLQDPLGVIQEMVRDWTAGWRIVLAARAEREDGAIRRVTSRLFYRLIRRHGVAAIPPGGFDFFLVDREVIRLLLDSGERHRFLQGDLLWFGYEAKTIPYVRKARSQGRSQWTIGRRLNYFIDAFVGYSYAPIRLASQAGLLLLGVAVLATVGLILQRVVVGTQSPGWTSLMIVMICLNAFQLIVLGIFGEYLWRHLEMTRARPQFLVAQVVGAGSNRTTEAGEDQ